MVVNEAEEMEVPQQAKGSRVLKWIIVSLILVALAGGGYAGWIYFQAKEGENFQAKPKEKITYDMDTFLVNLSDPGGKRYLKVTMKVVLSDALTMKELTARGHELRDAILMLLSSKKFDDIATLAGKTTLKHEAIAQLNRRLTKGLVEEVYFTEFLVQ
jgi:flagellar protein FliL